MRDERLEAGLAAGRRQTGMAGGKTRTLKDS